jgi:uncharacterized protein (DUF1697 family)
VSIYIALLRAVNVGGTGQLPMADLRALCEEAGLRKVKTYIASGNVVFASDLAPKRVQAKLEKRLLSHAGQTVGVFLRTAAEMRTVLQSNPFADREPRLTYSFFLNDDPPSDTLERMRGRAREEIRLGKREIYVFYPKGMGQSKLRIPAAQVGTARNMRTVAKLVAMSQRD